MIVSLKLVDTQFDKAIASEILDLLRDEGGFLEDCPAEDERGRSVFNGDSNDTIFEADILACIQRAREKNGASRPR